MSKETLRAPFRADVVGSFLRPEELKVARSEFAAGNISADKLREVENGLIEKLVAKQKQHGIHAFTDGEFRRAYWHLDFMWGLNNVEHIELEHGYRFHGIETAKGSIKLTGKIGGKNHPFVDDYRFIKQFEEMQKFMKGMNARDKHGRRKRLPGLGGMIWRSEDGSSPAMPSGGQEPAPAITPP